MNTDIINPRYAKEQYSLFIIDFSEQAHTYSYKQCIF